MVFVATLDNYKIQQWQILDAFTVKRTRPLRITVSTQDTHFDSWDHCMDVQTEGVKAQCDELYSLHEVTGLRFSVHAVLITQSLTANVLLRSCEQIEYYDLEKFGFMRSCATVTAESLGLSLIHI